MNIHGHKLKIATINAELKHEKDLGYSKVRILKRRKIMHQHLILKLRIEGEEKKEIMEFEDHIKLNKKDEKKINKLLGYFKKGLITGIFLYACYLLGSICGIIWQK